MIIKFLQYPIKTDMEYWKSVSWIFVLGTKPSTTIPGGIWMLKMPEMDFSPLLQLDTFKSVLAHWDLLSNIYLC